MTTMNNPDTKTFAGLAISNDGNSFLTSQFSDFLYGDRDSIGSIVKFIKQSDTFVSFEKQFYPYSKAIDRLGYYQSGNSGYEQAFAASGDLNVGAGTIFHADDSNVVGSGDYFIATVAFVPTSTILVPSYRGSRDDSGLGWAGIISPDGKYAITMNYATNSKLPVNQEVQLDSYFSTHSRVGTKIFSRQYILGIWWEAAMSNLIWTRKFYPAGIQQGSNTLVDEYLYDVNIASVYLMSNGKPFFAFVSGSLIKSAFQAFVSTADGGVSYGIGFRSTTVERLNNTSPTHDIVETQYGIGMSYSKDGSLYADSNITGRNGYDYNLPQIGDFGYVRIGTLDLDQEHGGANTSWRMGLATQIYGTGFKAGDRPLFGWSTSFSDNGRRLAVSAPNLTSGKVFIYTISVIDTQITVSQNIIVVDQTIALNAGFGAKVLLSSDGNLLIVSAPFEDFNKGAVYVFTVDYASNTAALAQRLANTEGGAFGRSMSRVGQKVLISAPYCTVNGELNAGRVYQYVINRDLTLVRTIQMPDPTEDDQFGKNLNASITETTDQYGFTDVLMLGAPGRPTMPSGHPYNGSSFGGAAGAIRAFFDPPKPGPTGGFSA